MTDTRSWMHSTGCSFFNEDDPRACTCSEEALDEAMAARPTPGPWHIVEDTTPELPEVIAQNGQYVLFVDHPETRNSFSRPMLVNPADARLIAAAPELYEALRGTVESWAAYDASEQSQAFDADEAAASVAESKRLYDAFTASFVAARAALAKVDRG
jgi:hypothetical protein